ncbi:MAG TPA: ATP-binding protein [Thermoanaerobaculia bacterium]|jgi:signal transduction histidine kinase/ActR/RegA family two-component response regulator
METEAAQPTRRNVGRYATGVAASSLLMLAFWPGLMPTLFGTGRFLPHSFCYLRDAGLVWTHAVTDMLIGLSYVAISAMLTLLVHRARRDIPFSWVFLAFGMFIVACGATHFMEVLVLWKATYWLSAAVKIVTAVASVATALVLPPLIPKAVTMVAEAKKSELRRIELQDRLEALERERAARHEAEEANRAKDAFLATISHELRTPMTAILGWSSMLNSGALDEQTAQAGVAAIEQSARAQAQLIDDLLDVSRIVTGKLALEPRTTELANVVRAAIETVSFSAERKEVRLEVLLPPQPLMLTADPARLHQVVTNLLSNAIKFTPAAGTITVELRSDADAATLTVRDTGIGIDADFLPFIFDRFTQADVSSTRGFGGLGIGLAIVRHLVELHGGTVHAESAGSGQGTTFTVRLPLTHAVVPADPSVTDAAEPNVTLAGAQLLLVEDERLAREMMCVALEQSGANVTAVGSVAEAMLALETSQPQVIVTDIAMPLEDGFSFLQRLRLRDAARGGKTPVIAVSALTRADERNRIMLAGFDDYVQKPVQPGRLTSAVARKLHQG